MASTANIVCLGWGSLIWDPRSLPVKGEWSLDGPMLPIEFARESADGRMTLVIVEQADPVPTLWTRLEVESLDDAVQALYEREGATWVGSIGRWPSYERQHRHADEIGAWAQEKCIDGVVWTDLKAGFRSARGPVPTLDEVTRHLGALTGESREIAEQYILRAPTQIATQYRPALEQLVSQNKV